MNIGILLPRSSAHPNISLDFIEGIKVYLQKNNLSESFHLFTENIGFGGVEKEIYEKAEKLLTIDEADILIAFLDLKVTKILEPLVNASGKLMIIVNPGANYPQNWSPKPGIVYLTLQHSFLCWLTGRKAAIGTPSYNGLMATTFYDCGYLHGTAMVQSFIKQGGAITFNYINNQAYDDAFDINKLTEFLTQDKTTDKLLCIFDALPASLFYKLLNDVEDVERLQLYVSPMMLETKALEGMGAKYKFSVEGYLPWHYSLDHEANILFKETMQEQKQKIPSVFSLLGWEVGMLLGKISTDCDNCKGDGDKIAEQLSANVFTSPRGALKLDRETNYFLADPYDCHIDSETNQVKLQKEDNVQVEWKEFSNQSPETIVTGWTNTYLCY